MLKYFPSLILSSYLIRLLITGASIGDSISISALCGLYGYFLYLESKKQVQPNKDIYEKIAYLEEQLGAAKTKLSSIQLSGLRK